MYKADSLLVETIVEDDGDPFDPDDDSLDDGQTEGSVSKYEGNLKERPLMMRFGPKECCTQFAQPKDRKAFIRVCGNKYGECPMWSIA
jgi:hypothetical protein